MNRKFLRWTLLGLIALVALASLAPTVGSWLGVSVNWGGQPKNIATKYTDGFCRGNGVSQVIDYGAASGKAVSVRCAAGFSGDGWELFAATGHSVGGTYAYPIGFVCKVDGWAGKGQDCRDTPTPREGTWVYYYATAASGDKWLFSPQGAASRSPACGSVEGWRFYSVSDDTSKEPQLKPEPSKC